MTDPHPAAPPTYPLPASTFHALVGPTARTVAALPWATASEPLHTDDIGTSCWTRVHWHSVLADNPVLLSYYIPSSLVVFDEVSMLLAVHGATAHWRCVLRDGPHGPWLVTDTLTASLEGRPLPAELVTRELPQDLGWVAGPPPLTGRSTDEVSIWHHRTLHTTQPPRAHTRGAAMTIPDPADPAAQRPPVGGLTLRQTTVFLATVVTVVAVIGYVPLPMWAAITVGAAGAASACAVLWWWARPHPLDSPADDSGW